MIRMAVGFAQVTVAIMCVVGFAAETYAAQGDPAGRWLAEDINGAGVIDRVQTTLEIAADGSYSGFGGCNGYSGQAQITADAIRFSPPIATRKACIPAVMDQEARFFRALEAVRSWRKGPHGKLVLLDESGKPVIRLAGLQRGASISFAVPGAETVDSQTVTYGCGPADVEVTYLTAGPVSLALLTMKDEFVVASSVLSGSGAKYAGAQYIWWSKGDSANLYDLMRGEDADPIACAAKK
ncbi:META domain-containing protein [Rhodoligotrophos defluvii]|uniref:META domain-containing protein n=1 Tax=Rhodoligotrophos defluvii TaxID=2561934 RepID=UPI001EF14366|nr:META domain-containing protein [Rhodoligotrophos defluvii]